MTSPKHRVFAIETIGIFAVLLGLSLAGIRQVPFFSDETNWISMSQPASIPPVPNRYKWGIWDGRVTPGLVALSLRTLGRPDEVVPWPWDFARSDELNRQAGAVPSPRVLFLARVPTAVLVAAGATAVYVLLRLSVGVLPGVLAMAFLMVAPAFRDSLFRVMNEGPLFGFSFLAAAAGLGALLSVRPYRWIFLMGVFGGLTAATKLTGLAILAPVFLVATACGWGNAARDRWRAPGGGAAAVLLSCLVFYLCTPFLHGDFFGHLADMFSRLQGAMEIHRTSAPQIYFPPGLEGCRQKFVMVFGRLSVVPLSPVWAGVNAAVVVVGMAVTWRVARCGPARSGRVAAALLLIFCFFLSLPSMASMLTWGRYFMFPAVFSAIFLAVALAWPLQLLIKKTFHRSTP